MGRRMLATVAAFAVVLATAIVISAPAGAFTSDGIQAVDVSTTPAGSVTVGQSFSVDVQWSGQAGGLAPSWGLSISISNEVHIDGFTPTSVCTRNGQVIDCRVAQGAPPISALTVHVSVTAVSEAYNANFTATAVSPEVSTVTDSTTLNIIPAGLTAEVHPFAFTGPDTLAASQRVFLTAQVANAGNVAMDGVTATLDLGSGLRFDRALWGDARNPCTIAGTSATCSIGTMNARSAVPLIFIVMTSAAATSTSTLSVTTTSAEQQPDPFPDSATLTRSIQPTTTDFGVEVGLYENPQVVVGATVTAVVTVTNHGPATATDITVTFTASDSYGELDGQTRGCTTAGDTVTCHLVDGSDVPLAMGPGGAMPMLFHLTPTTTAPATLHAEVTSTASEPDPDPTPNTATFNLPGATPASDDLQFVSWTPDTNPVVAGVATTSTLAFANLGPSRSRGLYAVLTFPATWTVTNVQSSIGGTCTPSGSSATCDLPEVSGGPGAILRLAITAIPSAVGTGQVANATITTDYPDPDGPMHGSVSYDVVDAPTLSVDSSTVVTEGGTAKLPIRLSAPTNKTVAVNCITGGWTATAGTDYVQTTQTVTFAAGSTLATLNVPTKQDALDEEDIELVLVACGGVQNAHPSNTDPTLGLMWSLIGIRDDDPLPTIVPGAIAQREGAASTVKLPVTLSAPSGRTVSVHWQTVNDDAVAPSDYTAASGTLTFQPGETSKTITITIKNDQVREPDEFFEIAFSNPQNATIGGFLGLGFVKILNDD